MQHSLPLRVMCSTVAVGCWGSPTACLSKLSEAMPYSRAFSVGHALHGHRNGAGQQLWSSTVPAARAATSSGKCWAKERSTDLEGNLADVVQTRLHETHLPVVLLHAAHLG